MDDTEIRLSFKNNVSGQKKLDEYQKSLEKIYALTEGLKTNSNVMNSANIKLKETNEKVKDLDKKALSLSKAFSKAFSIAKIAAFIKAITQVVQTMTKFVKASSEYIENVNLLEVAYKNANETIEQSSERIERYIDNMAELYGLDESNLTRQFGIFKQMANAMQLPAETAEQLSEHLVKMTNDVSSLYNLDLDRASNALQSALAGQVRPIRSATGADITEKTLQNTVDALELDRSISQLSYVEKRLVMVISLTNQLKNSQGDYARTIESTANQFRILGEQWSRLTRSVGNVFYNLLGSILPYLNGILMALTEIFNLIASLFGFEMPEFDYSNLTSVSDAALDIEDALNGAGDSADNLKSKLSGLRGFDKLNVISTPTKSGSSSSGGIGNIDPTILNAFTDAFKQYDDLMGSVRMKALDIRDAIMGWLGFTKEVNPITGEIEWKYEGIDKTLSNVWDSIKGLFSTLWQKFKELSPIAQSFVEIFGIFLTGKLVTGVNDFIKSLGAGGLGGAFKLLGNMIKGAGLDAKHPLQGMMIGADVWAEQTTKMQQFQTVLAGFGVAAAGIGLIRDAIKGMVTEGVTAKGVLEELAGTASTTLGGAMSGAGIAAMLGKSAGTGMLVGAVTGLVTSAATAAITAVDEAYKEAAKEHKAQIDGMKGRIDEVLGNINKISTKNKELSKDLINIDVYSNKYKSMADQLTQIVDENGKVKKGQEKNAQFITGELSKAYGIEITMTDGVIDNYKEMINKTYELIEAKRLELKIQKADEIAIETLNKRTEITQNAKNAQKELSEANINLINEYDRMAKGNNELRNNLEAYAIALKKGEKPKIEDYKLTKEQADEIKDYVNELKRAETGVEQWNAKQDAATEIAYYNTKLQQAYREQDTENINKYYNLLTDANQRYTAGEKFDFAARTMEAESYWKKQKNLAISNNEEVYEINDKGQKRINKNLKALFDENFGVMKAILTDETKYVNGVTPEMVKEWEDLAGQSVDAFNEIMYDMPDDLRIKVLHAMLKEGKNITPEMVEQFKYMATSDKDAFLEIMKDTPEDMRKDLIGKMKDAGYEISEDLQKGLDSIEPTIKVKGDTSDIDNKMDSLSSKIATTAWNFGNFAYELISRTSVGSALSNAIDNIKGVFTKENGGIFYNGGWHNIEAYASGGLPPVGQMFVARENGAELVGNINNHTAVMNNDQIVDSVADGVYRAVVNANATTKQASTSVTIPVQIGTKEIGRIVISDLQKMAKTNGKPIVIGG